MLSKHFSSLSVRPLLNTAVPSIVTKKSSSSKTTKNASSLDRMIPQHLLHLPSNEISESSQNALKKINVAIVTYLENAAKHKKFISDKKIEFELGKRHLANIMGWDPETITQKDIDKAIEYLFPSGLFEKKARPQMLPPEQLYARLKEAQYDLDGRPYHSFFFTAKPNFYQVMYDLNEHYQKLEQHKDEQMLMGQLTAPKEAKMEIFDFEWASHQEICQILLENIKQSDYNQLISNLEVLSQHPYSSLCRDFVLQFTKKKVAMVLQTIIPSIEYTESGRPYVKHETKRKSIRATVTVYGEGSGKFKCCEDDLQFFGELNHREQIMYPLKICSMENKVDIEVEAPLDSPKSALAGAIRLGVAKALSAFVDKETVEKMRVCGLLTSDRRVKERKKPGLFKARKRHTWKAR